MLQLDWKAAQTLHPLPSVFFLSGALPRSTERVDALQKVSFKLEDCLDGSCRWERTSQAEAEAVWRPGEGKWHSVCARSSEQCRAAEA